MPDTITTPREYEMGLSRRRADLVNACWVCTTEENEEHERLSHSVCAIDFKEYELQLCSFHEMNLLELLLNNYVRRLRRGKTKQVLLKEEEADYAG